jgi:hypothetical protein
MYCFNGYALTRYAYSSHTFGGHSFSGCVVSSGRLADHCEALQEHNALP